MTVSREEWTRLSAKLAGLWDEAALAQLHQCLQKRLVHAKAPVWQEIVAALPSVNASEADLNADTLRISASGGAVWGEAAWQLRPWRKGPFLLNECLIDSEWRSDMKFHRLLDLGVSFANKTVLDVGCGNGYFMLRAQGAGAALCVGVDPMDLFAVQFSLLEKMLGHSHIIFLPLPFEVLPQGARFDLILSMGVLYHRRDPLMHLKRLHDFLPVGGEVLLETLVIDGDERTVLCPPDRYAGMRNVWLIPSLTFLEIAAQRSGFVLERRSEAVETTLLEQRGTAWVNTHSLEDFVCPQSHTTIEGLPWPKRAMFLLRAC